MCMTLACCSKPQYPPQNQPGHPSLSTSKDCQFLPHSVSPGGRPESQACPCWAHPGLSKGKLRRGRAKCVVDRLEVVWPPPCFLDHTGSEQASCPSGEGGHGWTVTAPSADSVHHSWQICIAWEQDPHSTGQPRPWGSGENLPLTEWYLLSEPLGVVSGICAYVPPVTGSSLPLLTHDHWSPWLSS